MGVAGDTLKKCYHLHNHTYCLCICFCVTCPLTFALSSTFTSCPPYQHQLRHNNFPVDDPKLVKKLIRMRFTSFNCNNSALRQISIHNNMFNLFIQMSGKKLFFLKDISIFCTHINET